MAPLVKEEDSYYSEHSDIGDELKEAYKTLCRVRKAEGRT